MRALSLSALALAITLSTAMTALAQPRRGNSFEAARNGWLFSLPEGKRQAQQSGKPLLVVIRCDP
jgi:hypothetical protein